MFIDMVLIWVDLFCLDILVFLSRCLLIIWVFFDVMRVNLFKIENFICLVNEWVKILFKDFIEEKLDM